MGKDKGGGGEASDESKEEGSLRYLLDDIIVFGTTKDLDLKRDSKEEECGEGEGEGGENQNVVSISIQEQNEEKPGSGAEEKDNTAAVSTTPCTDENLQPGEVDIIQQEEMMTSFLTSKSYG